MDAKVCTTSAGLCHLRVRSPTQHSKPWAKGSSQLSPDHVPIPVSGLQGMGEKLGTFSSQVVTQLPSKSYTVGTQQNQKEGSLVEQTSCKKRQVSTSSLEIFFQTVLFMINNVHRYLFICLSKNIKR